MPFVGANTAEREKGVLITHKSRSLGGVVRTLAVVGIVFCVAVLSAGAAGADDMIQLRNRLSNFCLDATGPGGYDWLVINPCDGSNSQRWNLNGALIESVAFPGRCLRSEAALGSCIDLSDADWDIQPNGHVRIGARCLLPNGNLDPGTRVFLNWCSDDPGQDWNAVP